MVEISFYSPHPRPLPKGARELLFPSRCLEAALGNLGEAYRKLEEVPKAIDYYKQSPVIARDIGDRRSEGKSLGNLGIVYADLGEVPKAIDHYEQKLVIAREIGDRRGEGNTLFNMSLALHEQNEAARAIPLAEQALVIFQEIQDPNAARVQRKLDE